MCSLAKYNLMNDISYKAHEMHLSILLISKGLLRQVNHSALCIYKKLLRHQKSCIAGVQKFPNEFLTNNFSTPTIFFLYLCGKGKELNLNKNPRK